MSRITSNEVQGLMEAYNAVYAPQELTEEQIWEEVETWVNSLVEEGYDLSDYTWEDMYEAYIQEAPMSDFQAGGGKAALTPAQRRMSPRSSAYQTAVNRVADRGQSALFKAGGGQAALAKANAGRSPRSGRVTPAEIAEKGRKALASAPAKPAKPAAPARPAAPAPAARPAAPAPAARPAAPAPAAARPATPRPKPAPSAPSAPKPPISSAPIAPRPSLASQAAELRQMRAASQARQASMLKQSYDLYDVIKGHLLDEGYADTEEAAEAIMVSMSEDWKQSILEVSTPPHPVDLPPPVSSPPPVNSLSKLTIPPSVPKEKDKRLPKLTTPPPVGPTTPPPVPAAKIPPLPPVK